MLHDNEENVIEAIGSENAQLDEELLLSTTTKIVTD